MVELQILRNVPPHQIVQQNQDAYLHAYMAREGLSDKDAAAKKFLTTQPEKDYFLTIDIVKNIQRTVQQREWRRHSNQQQSVELWVQENRADVLLHQRQEPLPGTPDHEFLAIQQKAATAPPFVAAQQDALRAEPVVPAAAAAQAEPQR